jgi:2-polyprenyl-3-methyl-5-hydroxy-6-metoxy-1,4-benzoquinol methylase
MIDYPHIKKGVMIYCEDGKNFFLLNPYHASPQKLFRLGSDEAIILKKITGSDKIEDISRSVKIAKKDVLRVIKKFSSKEQDAVSLLDRPLVKLKSKQAKNTKYYDILTSIRNEFNSARKSEEDNKAIKEYHQERILDAVEQFNKVEMTVSHVYREPHVLLNGRNYGAAFADVLIKKGVVSSKISILEVGGGTGIFGKSFLDEIKVAAPGIYKTIKYAFFELSPALIKSQQKISRGHHNIVRFIEGDIESHNFRDEKFDLILSNEMVADLNVVKLRKADFEEPSTLTRDKKRSIDIISEYGINISDAPKEFLFNLKAIEFLILIKKILNPGGKAYIVEYGSQWGYPKAVVLQGHVEHSIHFDHLERVAQKLHMSPKLTCLVDLLRFNTNTKVVDVISWSGINNYLLPFLGHKSLSKEVYTEEMIKGEIGDIFNRLLFVSFSHLGKGDTILDPGKFLVLELSGV